MKKIITLIAAALLITAAVAVTVTIVRNKRDLDRMEQRSPNRNLGRRLGLMASMMNRMLPAELDDSTTMESVSFQDNVLHMSYSLAADVSQCTREELDRMLSSFTARQKAAFPEMLTHPHMGLDKDAFAAYMQESGFVLECECTDSEGRPIGTARFGYEDFKPYL